MSFEEWFEKNIDNKEVFTISMLRAAFEHGKDIGFWEGYLLCEEEYSVEGEKDND